MNVILLIHLEDGNMAVLVSAPTTGLRTFADIQEESRKRFG